MRRTERDVERDCSALGAEVTPMAAQDYACMSVIPGVKLAQEWIRHRARACEPQTALLMVESRSLQRARCCPMTLTSRHLGPAGESQKLVEIPQEDVRAARLQNETAPGKNIT